MLKLGLKVPKETELLIAMTSSYVYDYLLLLKSACQQLLSDFWDTFPKTFFYVIW